MNEQLDFFDKLHGDRASSFDETEQNDYGVYTKNVKRWKSGFVDENHRRCEIELKVCKKNGRLLFAYSIMNGTEGASSPLTNYSPSISCHSALGDIVAFATKYVKRVLDNLGIVSNARHFNSAVDMLIESFAGDLNND